MKKFIIIDAPCGAGKSSWAIQNIKQRGENIIVCTPFLDEIERYQKDCRPKIFVQPDNYGHSKIEDFNAKLAEGQDIGVTHATFLNATEETVELIRQGRYSLFLDEAIDLIGDFNMTRAVENDVSQKIGEKDLDMLLIKNLIEVDPKSYKVSWIGESYDGGKFSAIEQAAKSGSLYLVRGEFLARVFPPKIFEAFESVLIMTYILEGSYMQAYFDMYGIEYELKSLEEREDGYHLVDYSLEAEKRLKELIKSNATIWYDHKCDINSMSKYWFSKNGSKEKLKQLSNSMTYFVRHIVDAHAYNEDIMWTAPNAYRKILEGERFTKARSFTPQNQEHADFLAGLSNEEMLEQFSCFVPCNSRGTNRYKARWALMYCCDIHYNTMLEAFFTDGNAEREKNGLPPVVMNEEKFSLSCLIQWMFRSAIRDGKKIHIFIPSRRIRHIFLKWLYDLDEVDETKIPIVKSIRKK